MPFSQAELQSMGVSLQPSAPVGNADPNQLDQSAGQQIIQVDNPMKQGTGQGLTPAQLKAMGVGTQKQPVTRQPDQHFTGDEYDVPTKGQIDAENGPPTLATTIVKSIPIVRDVAPLFVDTQQMNQGNLDTYNQAGDKSLGPIRLQTNTDQATGNTNTEIVPPPGMTGTDRIIGGAIADFGKGMAELLGNAADAEAIPGDATIRALGGNPGEAPLPQSKNLTNTIKLGQAMLSPNVDSPTMKWIQQNFPTVPASNEFERQAQEIGSVALGFVTGQGIAKKAVEESPGVVQAATNLFAANLSKTDPANLVQKVQTFAKAALIEMGGGNVGASIATPDNSASLTGTVLQNTPMGQQAPEETKKLGVLADNEMLTGLGRIGKGVWDNLPFNAAKDTVTKALKGSSGVDTMAMSLLQQIDPNIKNASPEEIANRASILSKLLNDNADTIIGANKDAAGNPIPGTGSVWTSSPTVVLNNVGRQYFEQAYAFMKPHMSPEEWNAFIDNAAKNAPNQMEYERRFALNDPNTTVTTSLENSKYGQQTEKALGSIADKNATPEQVGIAARDLANTVAEPANKLADNIQASKDALDVANANHQAAQSATILAPVKDKFNTLTPFSTATQQQQELRDMSQRLLQRMQNEKDFVNSQFNNIPEDVTYDSRPIAAAIKNAGMTKDDISSLINSYDRTNNVIHPQPGGLPGVPGQGPVQKKMAQMQDYSLRDLFTKARPQLAQMKSDFYNSALQSGRSLSSGERNQIDALDKIIGAIDQQAYNSGSPEFQQALDAFAKEQDLFHPSQEWDNLSRDTNAAKNRPGMAGFKSDQNTNAYNIIDKIANGGDKSGEALNNYIQVLNQRGNPDEKQAFGQMLVNKLHSALAAGSADGNVSAQAIADAAQPYIEGIRKTLPTVADQFDAATQHLRNTEIDAATKQANHDALMRDAAVQTQKMNQNIVSKLVQTDSVGRKVPTGNYADVLKNIFNNKVETQDLMNEASKLGPYAEEAVRAQYARQHALDLMTSRVESAGGDKGFTRVPSQVGLNKAAKDVNAQIRDIVFHNAPDQGRDIQILDDLLNQETQARQIRANTYGPNTALDQAGINRKQLASMLIQKMFGYMNPVASQVRRVANMTMSALTQREIAQRADIYPQLVTNVHAFTEALDQIAKNNQTSDSVARQLTKISQANPLVRGFISAQRPETTSNDNTNAALGTVQKRVNSVK